MITAKKDQSLDLDREAQKTVENIKQPQIRFWSGLGSIQPPFPVSRPTQISLPHPKDDFLEGLNDRIVYR